LKRNFAKKLISTSYINGFKFCALKVAKLKKKFCKEINLEKILHLKKINFINGFFTFKRQLQNWKRNFAKKLINFTSTVLNFKRLKLQNWKEILQEINLENISKINFINAFYILAPVAKLKEILQKLISKFYINGF
jgi:hypothetical protein